MVARRLPWISPYVGDCLVVFVVLPAYIKIARVKHTTPPPLQKYWCCGVLVYGNSFAARRDAVVPVATITRLGGRNPRNVFIRRACRSRINMKIGEIRRVLGCFSKFNRGRKTDSKTCHVGYFVRLRFVPLAVNLRPIGKQ